MAARRARRPSGEPRVGDRTLDALPDPLDFRDLMYVPTLVDVPPTRGLDDYRSIARPVPVLDQGTEGACTGFGLATMVHYLLRTRRGGADPVPVSPRMLYEMARRYDEWAGEDYSGSSARGAMKGWHRHGVCSEELWPYLPADSTLTDERARDARGRPLGAYFRVNHLDVVAMHSAITEVGVLYVTCMVHTGWDEVGDDGSIPFEPTVRGGHAVAIVAYDRDGFWLQNSWGEGWGMAGFGHVSYDDWLQNGTDAWVARLGAPVELADRSAAATARAHAATDSEAYSYADIRPHVVSIGNDGRLRGVGRYGTSEAEVREIVTRDMPALMRAEGWSTPRVLLYAHGGLVPETSALQKVADLRRTLLDAQVYPIAFSWKSDMWTTIGDILDDATRRRRPEGFLDSAKDFMLDRLDDTLEPLTRALGGKALWDEMKENARLAGDAPDGGARLVADLLAEVDREVDGLEVHLVGHSAGSVFHGPLVQLLTRDPDAGGLRHGVRSVILWAPACTSEFFADRYLPAIGAGRVGRTAIFMLTDRAERDDDCNGIYNKSLLYLVADAFERELRIPLTDRDGVPILGMERFLPRRGPLRELIDAGRIHVIRSPNLAAIGSRDGARATSHGGFDDDDATLRASLARILGTRSAAGAFTVTASARSAAVRRREIVTADVVGAFTTTR